MSKGQHRRTVDPRASQESAGQATVATPPPTAPEPAVAAAIVAVAPPRRFRLKERELQQLASGFWCTLWDAQPEYDTPVAALKEPEYWANVTGRLKEGDEIRARVQGGKWYCRVYVRTVGQAAALVQVLEYHEFEQASLSLAAPGYRVEYLGSLDRWSVVRLKDGERIKKGAFSELDAQLWLREHLKAFSR